MTTAIERTNELIDLAAQLPATEPLAAELADLRARLDGPLRVAIAGRVKAGKSTLLNALVGERLAPTDAGECTRIVTWYSDGIAYDVEAIDRRGHPHPLTFRRIDGTLSIDLDGHGGDETARLEVTWPSRALQSMTLIDTPGLASLDDRNSLRTREFLAMGQDRPSDADVVIYLMRHLHHHDAGFLEAFLDRTVTASSPVNAIAVLSHADEIGAAHPDAMESARRIAARYQSDPSLRTLCTTVVPVAGLLAETGLTLREDEASALRRIALTPEPVLDRMLWSADSFCDPESSDLTVELRRSLLLRLGFFGLRVAIAELHANPDTSATDLARFLVDMSGLDELHRVIGGVFVPRAQVLKARSALVALREMARGMTDPDAARRLASEVERVETSPEFAQLRLAHLVLSGMVSFSAEELTELEDVTTGASEIDAAAALTAIERWRTRAANPLNDPAMAEACETMARTYEAIYVEAAGPD